MALSVRDRMIEHRNKRNIGLVSIKILSRRFPYLFTSFSKTCEIRSYRLSLKYRVDTLELEKNKKKEKYAINILKSEVNLARVKRCVKRFIIFEVYSCYKF